MFSIKSGNFNGFIKKREFGTRMIKRDLIKEGCQKNRMQNILVIS